MKRCKQCDSPLTITGTHCPRCNAPRDDLEEQRRDRQRRDPVADLLIRIVGIFFSLTFLLWFGACAALGAGAGWLAHAVLGVPDLLCWVIGAVVTLFLYALSWFVLIFFE